MSEDFDFSDEGLAKLGEAPDEAAAEEVVTDDAPVVDEAPIKDAPPAEAESEAVADTDEESYRKRYENLVPKLGEQGQELGELRKQLEAFMAQQAQPEPEPEPQYASPFAAQAPQSQTELLEMAATPEDAEGAYYFALEHAPDLLPDVLAEVGFHNPGLAQRMQMHLYQQQMAQQMAQLQEQVAPVQQTYAQQQAQQQTVDAVTQFTSTVENFDDIRDEVAKIIEEEPTLVGDGSPAQVAQGLRWAVRMANQARGVAATHAQAQATQQGIEKRQAAAVETGTNGAAPVVEDVDPGQQIANQILEQDRKRKEVLGY